MATIRHKIGFATESAEAGHAVAAGKFFAGKKRRDPSRNSLALPRGRKAMRVHAHRPRTPLGRLASGARLRLYRINGPGRGHRKTDKTRKHKAAMVKRRQRVAENQERRRARAEHKERLRRIALGLPPLDFEIF